MRVVFNGISTAEMAPVAPNPDAADIVSVGEFRHIKGTDVLIDAVAELHRSGRRVTLAVAGDGEEGPALRDQVARLGLTDSVRFLGHTPARQAFAHGRAPGRAVARGLAALRRHRSRRRRNSYYCQWGGRNS